MSVLHWPWKRYVIHRPKDEDGRINLTTIQVQRLDTTRMTLKLVLAAGLPSAARYGLASYNMTLARWGIVSATLGHIGIWLAPNMVILRFP